MKPNQSIAPQQGGTGIKGETTFSMQIGSQGMQKMLETAISDPKVRMRFTTSLIASVAATPGLKNCTTDSIVTAALQGQAFGFAFGLGCFYIIPYGNTATFQMGWKGYYDLAMRSGMYADIDTIEIREGEFVGRDKRNGKPIFSFIEDDEVREEKPIIGYLATFTLLTGFTAYTYFSTQKMLKHAHRYSQAFDKDLYAKYVVYQQTGEGMTDAELRKCSSPWYEDFNGMAFKTVLKQLLSKKGVLSLEMSQAIQADADMETDDGGKSYTFTPVATPTAPKNDGPQPMPEEVVIEADNPTISTVNTSTMPHTATSAANAPKNDSAPKRGRPSKTAQTRLENDGANEYGHTDESEDDAPILEAPPEDIDSLFFDQQ